MLEQVLLLHEEENMQKNIINFLYQYTVHIIISCKDHLASCKMGDTAKDKAQSYEEIATCLR